ncbi:serine protease inhibitor Cvsi-2-like [Crassostrea angulata]|uniref:Uncharacterized protein n=1 Tax=Magallana gigas TaxID=29159 RepID=A0A8W8N999_MAGGI|nr:serine protease inhibitor Cvsi-2-like [Crassostrea gigas]XP_052704750.1 serine protease inhibitor Cvsi-2-like [Crassostrea angulata]
MKVAILFAVLCVVHYTCAETCSATADCQNTKCDAAHDLECHRGQCTCVNHSTSCTTASDCSGTCHIFGRNGRWHCIDAKCRCFFV